MNQVIGMPSNSLALQLLDDISANLRAGDITATLASIEELREELKTL